MTGILLLVVLAAPVLSDPPEAVVPTAVVWHDRIVVADGEGRVRAWNRDLTPDSTLTTRMSSNGPTAIAAAGGALWGIDRKHAVTWDSNGAEWLPAKTARVDDPWIAFTLVEGQSVVISAAYVERLSDGRKWAVPHMKESQVDAKVLAGVKVVFVHGTTIAIGTEYGEWGGHLVTLDLATGVWNHFFDTLGYVTGITWTGSALAVSWSMSHMMSSSRVRLHGLDTTVLKEGPRLRDLYLRSLAWDQGLYAVAQQRLVAVSPELTVDQGLPLGPIPYGEERNAVGVSPGIAAFLSLAEGGLLLVPITGAPQVISLDRKTVKKLESPAASP